MRRNQQLCLSAGRATRTGPGLAALTLAGAALCALNSPADASLSITPVFDGSITGSGNASAIEGAINSAIGTLQGLYSPNNVSLTVDFSYNSAGAGNLLSTSQFVYQYSYSDYVNALKADAAANPANATLAAGVANLAKGNDATGSSPMAVTYGQALLLSNYGLPSPVFAGNAAININSTQPFDFTRPVSGSQFDAIGGLEHELDEVLGGGGAGSTLNEIAGGCSPSGAFPCNSYGSLDLYRYAAPGVPSFSTSSAATSYLSVDGGATSVVGFNQLSGGDFGDFAPPGAGPGQLIQNAFNGTGEDENYTTGSPEFVMEQAIGWDSNSVAPPPIPEPGSIALLGGSLLGLAALRRRRRA